MPSYGKISSTCPAKLELEMVRRTALGMRPEGGLGLAEHVERFAKLAWKDSNWHRWSKMIKEEICKGGMIALFGPASSGKTGTVSMVMLSLYWALSEQFTGLCSTTTLEKLDLRVWGEIKMRFRQARERYPWLPGNMIDSMRRITSDPKDSADGRDFRNGILGVACNRGGEWQGLGDYSGIKNKFVFLAADECHVMQPGFLQGTANLESNQNETGLGFTGLYLGNLIDLETPLGEAAEPACGWDALPDSDTSRVYKTKFFNGRAIQLVGRDSPNIPTEKYAGLISQRFLDKLKHDFGEGSPMYIAQAGGTIPRSSLSNRVITKEVCRKFNAFDPVVWGPGKLTKLYPMDVSYTTSHGDRTVGAPIAFGQDIEGKLRLAFLDRPKIYSFKTLNGGTVEEAIAWQVKEELSRWEIPESNFFYDGTGRSSFTAAAMRILGTAIQPVEFGGKASTRPNFIGRKYSEGPDRGDLLPCCEIFFNFVTELWFATRYLVEADQMRALPEDTAKDGYARLWKLVGANKMQVEPKEEMKARINRSPDLYDMFAVAVEGARRLGFVIGNDTSTPKPRTSWLKEVNKAMKEALKNQELEYATS